MSNSPHSGQKTLEDHRELSAARTAWAACAILLLLACGLWHIHLMNRWMERRSDLLPPWVGARVALSGGNPYAASTTQEIQRRFYGGVLPTGGKEKDKQAFAYPIYTAFFLAPLAWLPWPYAQVAFILCAVPVLAACAFGWLRIFGSTLSKRRELLLLALVFASWPMLIALRHQQLTLLAVVFLSSGCIALARNRPALAGALFACTAIKPQAAALLLLWVMLRAAFLREWRLPAAFLAVVATEFLAANWLRPSWLQEWLGAVADYHHYTGGSPSLCIFFGAQVGGFLLGAVVLLALAAILRNFQRLAEPRAIGISASLLLAITCALLPTGMAWVYNQTLLLPGCLFMVIVQPQTRAARALRNAALLCLACNYVLLLFTVFGETVTGPNNGWDYLPYFNQFLPSLIAVALATYVLTEAPMPAMTLQREPASYVPCTVNVRPSLPASITT